MFGFGFLDVVDAFPANLNAQLFPKSKHIPLEGAATMDIMGFVSKRPNFHPVPGSREACYVVAGRFYAA